MYQTEEELRKMAENEDQEKQNELQSKVQKDSLGVRFVRSVIKHRNLVILCFTVFTILCALCIPQVKVNYNLASYLPEEANSSQAIELMEEVYGSEIPNVRLYVQDISLSKAEKLSQSLRDVDGAQEVLWLGDQVDILQPLEVLDDKLVETWKTDDGYLFQLTINGDTAAETLDEIRELAYASGASEVALAGDAVTTVDAQESTSSEVLYIMLIAVLIIILIISLTSESWFEPVIFLLVLAMAIIMNMGTNIIKGEISFITQICAAVLQLAVSMDYAIVMLHTFRRYQKEYPDDPLEAMSHAMHKGFSVIFSSAAVTFFGFLSLSVMSFQIGVDLGIVLAKGIFFSFISVMFLMPCILLLCLKPLQRFEHKPLMPSFDKFGVWCTRLMIPLSLAVALIAVPSFLGQDKTDFSYGAQGFSQEGTQTAIEAEVINEAFGTSETWIMIVPAERWAEEKALSSELEALPKVESVISYSNTVSERIPTDMVPEAQRTQLINDGYSRLIIQTTLDSSTGTDYDMVQDVRGIGENHYGDESYLAGTQVSEYDLKNITTDDSMKVKLFSMGTIALVLMLMFRSLSIPLIVLLPIEVSIWINLAIPYFTGQSINYIGYLVIDAVQLGAAVDYAIIYTREYLEQRTMYPALKAAQKAISKSAITIMTSALILTIAGFGIFFVASNGIISEIGELIGRGALLAMFMMFTLLPLLFVLADWLIRHTTLGLRFYTDTKSSQSSTVEAKSGSSNNGAAKSLAHGTNPAYKGIKIDKNKTNEMEDTMTKNNHSNRKSDTHSNTYTHSKGGESINNFNSATYKPKNPIRSFIASFCCIALITAGIPTMNAYADESTVGSLEAQTTNNQQTENSEGGALATTDTASSHKDSGKEEVVYAKLSDSGSLEGLYVVNGFHETSGTTVSDTGTYKKVTNLSTDEPLINKDGITSFSMPEKAFYYEGELDNSEELPWIFAIDYKLDGRLVTSEELCGASGNLEIALSIKPSNSDTTFSDNYFLQISGGFDSDKVANLASEKGTIASSGKNQQVSFIVLPGNETSYDISAQVSDFSFDGFTIVGIPVEFAFDTDELNTEEVSGGMDSLIDAVAEIDDGVSDLQSGTAQFGQGLEQLNAQNTTLLTSSDAINQGIYQLNSAVQSLSVGSNSYTNGIAAQSQEAQNNASYYYSLAAEKQQLYTSSMMGAQSGLSQSGASLSQAYEALYANDPAAVKAALDSIAGNLNVTSNSLYGVAGAVGTDSDGLVSYQAQAAAYGASAETCNALLSSYAPLDEGIQALSVTTPQLSQSYPLFDDGLRAYTSGVSTLSSSYSVLQEGVGSLKSGTSEFRAETATLDQDLIDSVKDKLEEYLNPDFELHSFTDSSNTDVQQVQFIIMTDTIEEPEEDVIHEEEKIEETVWSRLLSLFQ